MKRIPIIPTLFLLFTFFTVLEVYLIFQLAELTNWFAALLIIIVSGMIGAVMIKRQGFAVWQQGMTEMNRGKFPALSIAEGVMIIIGGAFLMTPGVVTDLIGLSTLIPPIRRVYGKFLIKFVKKNFEIKASGMNSRGGGFRFHHTTMGQQPGKSNQRSDPRVRSQTTENEHHNPFEDNFPGSHLPKKSTIEHDEDVVDVEFERKD